MIIDITGVCDTFDVVRSMDSPDNIIICKNS